MRTRLNNDAKMFLLYVLGLPESRCGKPLGEHATRLGIKPRAYQKAKALLVECGFLLERKWQNERGRWVTEQTVTNDAAVSPGTHFPAVGDSTDRVAGDSPPEKEEQGNNASHPPPEDEPLAVLGGVLAEAERVLLSLRNVNRGLHLGVREARGLVEMAAEWLRRGVSPAELRRALSTGLPLSGVRSVVGFLRHRLVRKMPEMPPVGRPRETAPPADSGRGALVLCAGPGDDHMFRPRPGETECGECRRLAAAEAAGLDPWASPPASAVSLSAVMGAL